MTPATTPGAGLPRPPGQPGEGLAGRAAGAGAPEGWPSPRAARALLVAGAIVAAVAAAAYGAALATHPWKSLLNGFDLQVYLGGAREARFARVIPISSKSPLRSVSRRGVSPICGMTYG